MFKCLIFLCLIFVGSAQAQADSILESWQPTVSQQYDSVPRVYKQWWNEISDCAHIKDTLSKVAWWKVDDIYFSDEYFLCPIGFCIGWTNDKKVYIAGSFTMNRRLVEHEMLHVLLGNRNAEFKKPHHKLFIKCKV